MKNYLAKFSNYIESSRMVLNKKPHSKMKCIKNILCKGSVILNNVLPLTNLPSNAMECIFNQAQVICT
jgi:hypothetical protein